MSRWRNTFLVVLASSLATTLGPPAAADDTVEPMPSASSHSQEPSAPPAPPTATAEPSQPESQPPTASPSPTPDQASTGPAPTPTQLPSAAETSQPSSPTRPENELVSPGDELGLVEVAAETEEPADLQEHEPFAAALPQHPVVQVHNAGQFGHGWLPDNTTFPGDWDGDGYDDQLMRSARGELLFYRGRADGSLYEGVRIGHGWGAALELLGQADWDGDGLIDLVARFTSGNLILYSGDGSGGFLRSSQIGRGWGGINKIALLPQASNGYPAIVGLHSDGRVLYYPSDGVGSFAPAHTLARDANEYSLLEAAGDWDGNSYSDLIAIDRSGRLVYLPLAGARITGRFQVGRNWQYFLKLGVTQAENGAASLAGIRQDGMFFRFTASTARPVFSYASRPATLNDLGKSWRPGCPVGPEQLSVITMNFWDSHGRISRGNLIVRSDLVARTTTIFKAAFAKRFPISKMRTAALYDGNDITMMADDNTSAFNCRQVVGNPYRVSPHSYGYAVDINTVKNPYFAGRWYPSAAYSTGRSASIPGMHMADTVFPVEFRRHGGHWGGCYRDYHHFELTTQRC